MDITEFDYYLPEELIARYPLQERTQSKLLLVAGHHRQEDSFSNLLNYLKSGDVLILNNTRVNKTQLLGRKQSGGRVEFLCTAILSEKKAKGLIKSNRKLKLGVRLIFSGRHNAKIDGYFNNEYFLSFDEPVENIMRKLARIALPPYLKRDIAPIDEERYQTVYGTNLGALAAPTAGLHFDRCLLGKIELIGVKIGFITLHVGLGTFLPVKTVSVSDHIMHEEYIDVPHETVKLIQQCKSSGGRVIAVGTTVLRALETVGANNSLPNLKAYEGTTRLFVTPGYKFRIVDQLITNFHLPRTTLLMLVYAFGGINEVRSAYRYAVEKKFRFFSYGDAMLVYRR